MNTQFVANAYTNVQNQASASAASPHKLILMLFDGALERIAQAKGAMQYRNISLKGDRISSAIAVVGGLRESLDLEQGGDIAHNLDALYIYIQKIMRNAHSKDDSSLLDEAAKLLNELRDAWFQIG